MAAVPHGFTRVQYAEKAGVTVDVGRREIAKLIAAGRLVVEGKFKSKGKWSLYYDVVRKP